VGYASTFSCHSTADAAAVETCSRLIFGYSAGVASCQGVADITDDVATLDISYVTPSGTTAGTLSVPLQPCEEITTQDAVDISWGLIAAAVALGALAMMRRAAR
jgi:hypothetical protein